VAEKHHKSTIKTAAFLSKYSYRWLIVSSLTYRIIIPDEAMIGCRDAPMYRGVSDRNFEVSEVSRFWWQDRVSSRLQQRVTTDESSQQKSWHCFTTFIALMASKIYPKKDG